ncbi:MAG: type II secretion system F family protein [Oscillospiraceae bacterium]|nr:type II secretion system F family protein [Oscillospiraceae bacterium]
MKTFIYTATDVKGNTFKNQRMQAENVNEFLDKIHEKGLFCSAYKEAKGDEGKKLHKFKTKEMAYDCRQMSAMMSSGLTLVRSLDIMTKEQTNEKTRAIYRDVYESVQKGTSFSDALKMQGDAYPNFYVSMIEAGEVSGNLDVIMKKLEDHYANEERLNRKIKSSMSYPIILVVLCLVLVVVMFTFIMPSFKDLLTEEDMNGLTGALFAFAENLTTYWYAYIIAIAVIVFVIRYVLKIPDVRMKFDKLKITMPAVGPLIVKIYTARFGSTLAALYSSGVSMVESLEKSANIVGNVYVAKCFETVVDEVKQGESLSVSIQRTGIFESMFTSIIYVGEESGALDSILLKSANFYQEESDEAITRLVGMIEPILIIFMGGAIGLCFVAILPAIYNAMGSIG